MEKYGEFIEADTIRFERLLPGPIERVWAWITESEKRGKWLASGEMDLRVGGKVELVFNNNALTPHKETVPDKYSEYGNEATLKGKITAVAPPKLLSFTWEEPSAPNSEVTIELSPQEDRVLLELTHRRLGDNRETLLGVGAGWHTHLGILVDKLNGKIPKGFWKVHMQLEEIYAKRV